MNDDKLKRELLDALIRMRNHAAFRTRTTHDCKNAIVAELKEELGTQPAAMSQKHPKETAVTKTIMSNVKVEEVFPEQPTEGHQVWRLLTYTDDGFPMFELYRAVFEMNDDGNAEIGPHASLDLGHFEQVGGGMGLPDLEQEIEHHRSNAADDGPYGRIV